MSKTVRATLSAIGIAMGTFIVLAFFFWLFELMGFDYLLWDAAYDSQGHTGNWVNRWLACLLYLLLPFVLSIVGYNIAKSQCMKRFDDPKPPSTDSGDVSAVAKAMTLAGYRENLTKARGWLDYLFPKWPHLGTGRRDGCSTDGSEEWLVRLKCDRDADGFYVQVHFMVRRPGATDLLVDVEFLTTETSPATANLRSDLCEFTADRLEFLKGALENLSRHALS